LSNDTKDDINSYYNLLGLQTGASVGEINQAYQRLRSDIETNLSVIADPRIREEMEELLRTADRAQKFLVTFTMRAEANARTKEKEAQQREAKAAADAARMSAGRQMQKASEAPKHWDVNTEGVESLDDATLDHLVKVACGKVGNHSYDHQREVGRMLVPVLVKAGDWNRLIFLVKKSALPDTKFFAMHGIGAVMQMMAASGKDIPGGLHETALAFIKSNSSNSFDDCRDVGKRLAGFYRSAGLWEPLLSIISSSNILSDTRVLAMESAVGLMEDFLKTGRVVPEAAYALLVRYLHTDSGISYDDIRRIGTRILGISHNYNLKGVLLKIGTSAGILFDLQEKANLLALDLVSGGSSRHPDPANAVKRQMAQAIEAKAKPPPLPEAKKTPMSLPELRRSVLRLPPPVPKGPKK